MSQLPPTKRLIFHRGKNLNKPELNQNRRLPRRLIGSSPGASVVGARQMRISLYPEGDHLNHSLAMQITAMSRRYILLGGEGKNKKAKYGDKTRGGGRTDGRTDEEGPSEFTRFSGCSTAARVICRTTRGPAAAPADRLLPPPGNCGEFGFRPWPLKMQRVKLAPSRSLPPWLWSARSFLAESRLNGAMNRSLWVDSMTDRQNGDSDQLSFLSPDSAA